MPRKVLGKVSTRVRVNEETKNRAHAILAVQRLPAAEAVTFEQLVEALLEKWVDDNKQCIGLDEDSVREDDLVT